MRDAEAPVALEIWRRSGATPSATDTVEVIRAIGAEDHAVFLAAEIDGVVVGIIIATFDGWRGNVYRLAVLPEHRRTGIATQLLDAAERTMAEWGVRRVSALVEHEHGWATSFWESAGYEADRKMARYVRSLDPGAEHATRIASAEVPSSPHDRGEPEN